MKYLKCPNCKKKGIHNTYNLSSKNRAQYEIIKGDYKCKYCHKYFSRKS